MGWRQANEITDWKRSDEMTEENEKNGNVYCPTQEEIQERAAEIRKTWDKNRWQWEWAQANGLVGVDFVRDEIRTDRMVGREGVIDNNCEQYLD